MEERDIQERNELSDIVLNKNQSSGSNKKIVLAVATLGVVLIIVVMLMNTLSSSGTDNLPQAVLPPQPQKVVQQADNEPLFEEVEVVNEDTPISSDADLDEIAQKLKQESAQESAPAKPVVKAPVVSTAHKTVHTKPAVKKSVTKAKNKPKRELATSKATYYIQVGSFSKYKPNKNFLAKITKLGFHYKYHKVNGINKVLVGPFSSRKKANKAKKVLRAKVEPGAFLFKL